MKRNLLLLTLLVALPVLGTAQDLPRPGLDPAPAAPGGLCDESVGENPATVPPAVPEKGPPFLKGWCRFSCGSLQCETSADCPDGVPCDSFIICPFSESETTPAVTTVPEFSSG